MNAIAALHSAGHSINSRDVVLFEYVKAVRELLSEGELRDAFTLLQQAIVNYPDNPYILSYFGYLQAALEKRYRSGVDNCRKALFQLERKAAEGECEVPPEMYLNLSRAYIAACRRKLAVECLEQGLRFDRHGEIRSELRTLGIRKKPPVPFLDRSNPINKYIGMIIHLRKEVPSASFSQHGY